MFHLQNDLLFKDILDGDLASQPTLSRFENGIEKKSIFALCYVCIERYMSSLEGCHEVIIDSTDTDPTHGAQQLSMFIESAHRTVIQQRMKLSGQHGSRDCANNMLRLRVIAMNKQWHKVINQLRLPANRAA
jgi:transposase-like protein